MQTKIIGSALPVLEVELAAGESVIGAPEQLSWIAGGVFGPTRRAVSGDGVAMTVPGLAHAISHYLPKQG